MQAVRLAQNFALGLSLLAGAALHAQKIEGCPWLNAATAGGVLGGAVRMSVTNTNGGVDLPNGAMPDATCAFTLLHSASPTVLRIVVRTAQDPTKDYGAIVAACGPSPRHVVGIGNEAVGCALQSGTVVTQQIVARVRRRLFVLSVSKAGSETPSREEAEASQSKLQNAAEQIAGSLF